MTVDDTVHDKKASLIRKGAGGRPLRHELQARFKEICRQASTKNSKMERSVELKSDCYYKIPWGSFQQLYGC